MKRRVLLATTDPGFAGQVRSLISETLDLELTAEVQQGAELLESCRALAPHAAVLEGEAFDLEVIEQLGGEVPVLVVSDKQDDASIFAALQAGVRGYVLDYVSAEVLLRALRAVANGEAIFSQGVAERVTKFFTVLPARVPELFLELTPRELEVMRLLIRRFSTKEISRRLEVRPKTVRNHVSNIVSKLQVKNRIEAVELATEQSFQ